MQKETISILDFPSMPAPLSTAEPGEAWVWEDYVATLQVRPIKIEDIMAKIAKKEGEMRPSMALEYPFAFAVFHKKSDRNPSPSGKPILVATLERANYAAAAAIMAGEKLDPSKIGEITGAPIVQGLFIPGMRLNLGHFDGILTIDTARKYFFDVIRERLALTGEPVKIGAVASVHGHPSTGWSDQKGSADKTALKGKQGGCASLVSLLGLVSFLLWLFMF
jgi:hypothetical protein